MVSLAGPVGSQALGWSNEMTGPYAVPSNKGMKLTKPGQLRSFAAYPQCSLGYWEGDAPPMALARSRFEAPSARRERMRRSSDTVGSPPSILATRD